MRFIDECSLRVVAGKGGDGCVAFMRAKFVPFGGPSGGDGGNGGSVIFVGDEGKSNLGDISQQRLITAESGENGRGRDCYGRGGKDTILSVPVGTLVFDADTGTLLGELTRHGQEVIVARGGKGGWGNKHFVTATDRAPRRAEPGEQGESFLLRLELKVLADVGLLGYPNAGKSTLIRAVSAAKPQVADYPFTTLRPHVGVVRVGDHQGGLGQSFVMADIPGLIEGASAGAGLGVRFLKHLERTRVLLHLVTVSEEPGRNPISDYKVLRRELERFDQRLSERPELVVLTKLDLTHVRESRPDWAREFAALGIELHAVSAATHEGTQELMNATMRLLLEQPR